VSDAFLTLGNCCFAYPGADFRLDDVSVGADRGEVLGVVGPNGSGKSTLLRLMSGFLRPDAGQVLLEGVPVRSLSRRSLAQKMAFLPQAVEPAFGFAVREVVAMGRYPYQGAFGFTSRSDMVVVERALEQTEATSLAARSFLTLSGGEKQRVLVASILAQEPAVMLLDEPTAALDMHHAAQVFDLLQRLSRQRIAVVIVTHDLNSAARFCDRLVLLSKGRAVRSGTPVQVMDQDLLCSVYQAQVRVVDNPVTSAPMAIVLGRGVHEAG
jgi:iron complex transport system ATP-binding protein